MLYISNTTANRIVAYIFSCISIFLNKKTNDPDISPDIIIPNHLKQKSLKELVLLIIKTIINCIFTRFLTVIIKIQKLKNTNAISNL